MTEIDGTTFDDFFELLDGRHDAVLVDPPRQVKLPLKVEDGFMSLEDFFDDHLNSTNNIGVYPLRDGHECRWICTDLDDENAEENAWKLYAAWEYYGVQAWVETSRSKGYHVWVFCEDWISGTIARRAGLYVHEIAGVEAKELNPKHELTDGFGNCVRLPYPKKQHGTYRQCMWHQDRTTPYSIQEFVEQAMETRVAPETLQRLAQTYRPPETTRAPSLKPKDRSEWSGQSETFKAKEVFYGRDDIAIGERDNTFWTLACYLWTREFSREEATDAMRDIWENQTEDHKSYSWNLVKEKINRVYERGIA